LTHWLLDSLTVRRTEALAVAERIQVQRELGYLEPEPDTAIVLEVAFALEMVVLDLITEGLPEGDEPLQVLRKTAEDTFRLLRAATLPSEPLMAGSLLLRMSALAVLGDKGADAARLLRHRDWPLLPVDSADWGQRTWASIIDVWLRLIRKKGWEDRDQVLERIHQLRQTQADFEERYLNRLSASYAKSAALELIGLYHLAKAAEVLALFITDGRVDGNYRVDLLLDSHFDRSLAVCANAQLFELEPLTRLLAACARQLVENSIWTVTRSVNSRVTQFVQSLVDHGRGDRALFDVLPPQRRTLAEAGLLGSSRRAVVVSLPTSSGKTLIAQFRILQALNQFDQEQGWVAYLAPTRALVNQLTRQLRRDFAPLGIQVEQVSPALDLDRFEMNLLGEQSPHLRFRVLVTTPEKLDLLLRRDWEAKIGRPLTLVVVDEAHNLQSPGRGLKLELLLSTINKECEKAQFLLLTPFIKNAREVARWLGGRNSGDISLSVDWQPNDRLVGIAELVAEPKPIGRGYNYQLELQSVHTSRCTIAIEKPLVMLRSSDHPQSYSQVSDVGTIAALMARSLSHRGPVIVMHSTPAWVWGLAQKLVDNSSASQKLSPNVRLVCDYVKLELGADFPLVNCLRHGIGVHHAGLPDDIRVLMEWLFEEQEIKYLAATTTIAQGVNFPVSAVIMASNQYPSRTGSKPMPPEDFWNIAGRAGRVGHGELGVVALAAENADKAEQYRAFINQNVGDLNSELIALALEARDMMEDLKGIVFKRPAWSSFLQYLAHTYLQMGKPDNFFQEIEQILRGTLGFEKLRTSHRELSTQLLAGIKGYTDYLQQPGQPLKLVDSTGFSLQSIRKVLGAKRNLNASSWDEHKLFARGDATLKQMMGVLLQVPELRENLKDALGKGKQDGEKLALVIKDWVNGVSLIEIARQHFATSDGDKTTELTRCGQGLFGKLAQTASWGLGALLAITGSELPEEELQQLSNLPSRVFYGVNSDAAMALRLLGIPRTAAPPLAKALQVKPENSLPDLRAHLLTLGPSDWEKAMGRSGSVYHRVWRKLEGLD